MTLAPCPYCHNSQLGLHMPEIGAFCVWCLTCHAHGPFGDTEGAANELWNLRKFWDTPGDPIDYITDPKLREWARHQRNKDRIGYASVIFLFMCWLGWMAWFTIQVLK